MQALFALQSVIKKQVVGFANAPKPHHLFLYHAYSFNRFSYIPPLKSQSLLFLRVYVTPLHRLRML